MGGLPTTLKADRDEWEREIIDVWEDIRVNWSWYGNSYEWK